MANSNDKSASNRVFVRTTVALLLTIQAVLLGYSATCHSPTLDEPASLAAGVSNWTLRRFELYRVNPPLVRLVAAAPVVVAGCETDWSHIDASPGARSEFAVGADFIHANGARSVTLLRMARWAVIPFSLLGGILCFQWSRRIWNRDAAGLVSLFLWTFEPLLLAHAELITSDCAATSTGIGAGYFFCRWLQRQNWSHSLAAGAMLGAAVLAKSVWIILFGLWPVLAIVWWRSAHKRPTTANTPIHWSLTQLGLLLVTGCYVINIGYSFRGTCQRLDEFVFVSNTLSGKPTGDHVGNRFQGTLAGMIPVPFPAQFVMGIDSQKKDFESHTQQSYLRGQWQDGGWWYYYIYGLGVKSSHGTQILILVAVLASVLSRRQSRHFARHRDGVPRQPDMLVLSSTAGAVLLLVSSQLEFTHHVRYVLPVLGLLTVFAGGAVCLLDLFSSAWRRVVYVILQACLVANIVSLLSTYPHHLAYFNELSGGPRRGHLHLLNSNLDWGQDLLSFRSWLSENSDERPVFLAYYGLFNPADIGVSGTQPIPDHRPEQPVPGLYAVSKEVLYGGGHLAYGGTGPTWYSRSPTWLFTDATRVKSFGYTIELFDIKGGD